MTIEQIEKMRDGLTKAHNLKTQKRLIQANAEIDAIQREDVAYYDGVFDAVKEVIRLIDKEADHE